MGTLHCELENGADLHLNERQKIRNYRDSSTEERRIRRKRIRRRKKKKKNAKSQFFYFARCIRKFRYYRYVIHSFDWKSAIRHDGGV